MTTEVRTHWLVTIGLIGLVVGVIDPLEGSVVILVASGLVALGTHRMRSPHQLLAAWGFVLLVLGFAAMWTITAFGGVDGSTGHSAWWATLVAPYVVGWALGIVAGVRTLVEHLRGRRTNDPPEGSGTSMRGARHAPQRRAPINDQRSRHSSSTRTP